MKNQNIAVKVSILDKEYQISCKPDEEKVLKQSADYLNEKMHEIRDMGNVIGSDRVAVMAALNIAHEFLKLKSLEDDYKSISQRIGQLRAAVTDALSNTEKKSQHELI